MNSCGCRQQKSWLLRQANAGLPKGVAPDIFGKRLQSHQLAGVLYRRTAKGNNLVVVFFLIEILAKFLFCGFAAIKMLTHAKPICGELRRSQPRPFPLSAGVSL